MSRSNCDTAGKIEQGASSQTQDSFLCRDFGRHVGTGFGFGSVGILILVLLVAFATVTTSAKGDILYPSTTNKAYKNIGQSSRGATQTEYSSSDYTTVGTSDDSRVCVTENGSDGGYTGHHYTFQFSLPPLFQFMGHHRRTFTGTDDNCTSSRFRECGRQAIFRMGSTHGCLK